MSGTLDLKHYPRWPFPSGRPGRARRAAPSPSPWPSCSPGFPVRQCGPGPGCEHDDVRALFRDVCLVDLHPGADRHPHPSTLDKQVGHQAEELTATRRGGDGPHLTAGLGGTLAQRDPMALDGRRRRLQPGGPRRRRGPAVRVRSAVAAGPPRGRRAGFPRSPASRRAHPAHALLVDRTRRS